MCLRGLPVRVVLKAACGLAFMRLNYLGDANLKEHYLLKIQYMRAGTGNAHPTVKSVRKTTKPPSKIKTSFLRSLDMMPPLVLAD